MEYFDENEIYVVEKWKTKREFVLEFVWKKSIFWWVHLPAFDAMEAIFFLSLYMRATNLTMR